jgi:predicted sugar kinase
MPAAVAGDFHAWSSAICQFNRSSGMLFAPIQGGPYNGRQVQTLIEWLLDRGVVGVGQSSWGPGVFAWFQSPEHAEPIIRRLPAGVQLIALARTKNVARTLTESAHG